jgi:hypothetical protein
MPSPPRRAGSERPSSLPANKFSQFGLYVVSLKLPAAQKKKGNIEFVVGGTSDIQRGREKPT